MIIIMAREEYSNLFSIVIIKIMSSLLCQKCVNIVVFIIR
jgi:hypothetical protein